MKYLITLTLAVLTLYAFVKRTYKYASVNDEVEAPIDYEETREYKENEIFEHSVRTTRSLLECKIFYSKADAQETADKHGFVVRKVIVKVDE